MCECATEFQRLSSVHSVSLVVAFGFFFSPLKLNCFYDCRCYLRCCGLERGYHLLFVIAFLCRLIMSQTNILCAQVSTHARTKNAILQLTEFIHHKFHKKNKRRNNKTMNSSLYLERVPHSHSTMNSYGSYRRNMRTSDTHIKIHATNSYTIHRL